MGLEPADEQDERFVGQLVDVVPVLGRFNEGELSYAVVGFASSLQLLCFGNFALLGRILRKSYTRQY